MDDPALEIIHIQLFMFEVYPRISVSGFAGSDRPAMLLAILGVVKTEKIIEFVEICVSSEHEVPIEVILGRKNFLLRSLKKNLA